MAGTIRINLQVDVANGNFLDSVSVSNKSFVQDNPGGGNPGTLSIGTSEESVALSELGTQGWLFMQNLDDTNYVRWGFATTVYGGRLEPGEVALFRLNPGSTLYMISNSAACRVNIRAFED